LRYGVVLIGLVAAAAVLAGCGGSKSAAPGPEPGSFRQSGFDITFDYPKDLIQTTQLKFGTRAGSADAARAAVGIDRDNMILVSRYDLRRPVTTANVGAVKPEVDGVIRQLSGTPMDGARIDVGGLPGYRYRVSLPAPAGGVSRLYVLFDRKVEYFLNCQSTPESRDRLDQACDRALDTLRRPS
jgi:hypothetical protein